jgi:hypothetical protein|tara:strand:+ start:3436 stop:4911 length:1476 start_codon:yes stop_codon:yes gene_type:complete
MNIPIWTGTSKFVSGSGDTAFGFYDAQSDFQIDADKVANFCARRMGYPLVDIELQSGSFYTAFEEAITTYGNELYAYKIRDNQLSLEGASTGSNLNHALITPNFEPIVRLTEQYGSEAGSGGNIPWYSGSFTTTASVQDYSFSTFMSSSGYTGSAYDAGIEVKRVFYQPPFPASARYLDPYDGFGFGGAVAAGIVGFGGFGMGMGYLMAPLNYDLQVIQQIEMNEMIRMNNYSFEIHNDKLRIFPIPQGTQALRGNSLISGSTMEFSATTATLAGITAAITGSATTGSGASFVVTATGGNVTKVAVVATGSKYIENKTITISKTDLDADGNIGVVDQDITLTVKNRNLNVICAGGRIWFEYILRNERINQGISQRPDKVTNVSNTPYSNPNYDQINSIGRQWVFEYTLAISKEMLGYVRGKYSSIPIPNAEVNLNQGDLIAAATAEKAALIDRLRTYFDETSRQALLNRRASEAESKMIELQQVPYTIYIA